MNRFILSLLTAFAALAQCNLSPGPGLHLGPTPAGRMRSTGEIKIALFFVDFDDAPASENARQLFEQLVPYAQQWIDEVSYGRARLSVQPTYQWFRMPKRSADYGFLRGLTFEAHRDYIADAVRLADASFDFSQYDGVYILASKGAQIPVSSTWLPNPGQGLAADGVELRHVTTLGVDVREAIPNYVWHVITHETGHLWGLPDLYLFAGSGLDVLNPASGWDNMSWIRTGAHFTAWQKRKLGWLLPQEFACVTGRSRLVELAPLESMRAVRGLAVQLSPTRALVAEVRRPLGHDLRLCDQGLLVYSVDSQVPSGSGPLVVRRALADTDQNRRQQCGPAYAATFNLTPGKPDSFRDPATGVEFQIAGAAPNGGLYVQVTNPGGDAIPDSPQIASVVSPGAFGGRNGLTPGGWAEIFGSNFSTSTRTWQSADFDGPRAPEVLSGVRVFMNGRPAFVSYISPHQINAQVPDVEGSAAGVRVVVANGPLVSSEVRAGFASRLPGLLAPPEFAPFVLALLPDGAFAGPPGLIAGVPFRRARPGETVVLYGVGFGATTPPVSAGIAVPSPAALPNVRVILDNLVDAQVLYAGLAPNLIGLYQINCVVPRAAGGDAPLTVSVDGITAQTSLRLALESQ